MREIIWIFVEEKCAVLASGRATISDNLQFSDTQIMKISPCVSRWGIVTSIGRTIDDGRIRFE